VRRVDGVSAITIRNSESTQRTERENLGKEKRKNIYQLNPLKKKIFFF
jgi:hypothetical protein